jgi:hypothetical protein
MPTRPTLEYYAAWEKCRRLGKELSVALAETGDTEFAFIQPAGKQCAVSFGELTADTRTVLEYPVTTVERLTTRLAFALDDWAEHTTFKSVAHVYPASTERGVYLMNMKTEVSRETPERANARLWDLLAEAGRIIAARPELKVDYVQVDENGAHWFHRIPGEARRPR